MNFVKYILLFLVFLSCASKRGTIIAHRGASGYLPEHTLEGVAMAHSWDIDYIEPDIVMTKDNRLVVLHDIHLDTTTNVAAVFPNRKRSDGRFYAIDFKLDEIKKLKVHERINLKTQKQYYPNRFMKEKKYFRVPTLSEFIEFVQGLNRTRSKKIGIYPEIKSPEFHKKEGKDITKKVVALLRAYGYDKEGQKIFIQCFYPPTLKRLKVEFKVKMPLVLLIADNSWNESSIDYDYYQTEEGLKEVSKYVEGVGPWMNQLYKVENDEGEKRIVKTNFVEWAHKHGLKVHPYTHRLDALPDGFRTSKELLDFMFGYLKIDGIFSDFADTVVDYYQGS